MHLLAPDEHKDIARHLRKAGLAHVVETANKYGGASKEVIVDIGLLRGKSELTEDFLAYADFHGLIVRFDDKDRDARLETFVKSLG